MHILFLPRISSAVPKFFPMFPKFRRILYQTPYKQLVRQTWLDVHQRYQDVTDLLVAELPQCGTGIPAILMSV